MDIELKREAISGFILVGKADSACETSADAVVPDTQEDILRVLTTKIRMKIKSKDVDAGKVTVSGEVCAEVIYIPEAGDGIRTLSVNLPFTSESDIKNADSSCSAVADIRITSADTRLLNPRKILVKCELYICTECFAPSETEWWDIPEDTESGLFFRQENESVKYINLVTEKTFSLEDEFNMPEGAENGAVLGSDVRYVTDSAETVGNKLIVKGHADICVMYLCDGKPAESSFTTNYSQLFELNERDIMPDYRIVILSTGEYFEVSDGILSSDLRAVAQLICGYSCDIRYVSDAYACKADVDFDPVVKPFTVSARMLESRGTAQMTVDTDTSVGRIIGRSSKCGKISVSDGKISVPVTVEVIYTTPEGEMRSGRVRSNVILEPEMSAGETITYVGNIINDIIAAPMGNGIDVRVNTHACICLEAGKNLAMLSSIKKEETECGCEMPSVYMCRAESDDLWYLAKKYCSDIAGIKRTNGIESDEDITGKLLLIPRMK